ncbi:MAG: putative MATE family efflux protein [Candidatus Azotimanducaceae bacterium]
MSESSKTDETDQAASVNPRDFTQNSVASHLTRLTGYMVLGLISVMGANLVEAIYIANVSTEALAALSFTFPLVMVFQGIAMGLGIGASSVVARTMGLGDPDKAKKLITHSFILVMLLVLTICVLAYFYVHHVFRLLGAEGAILILTVDYMQTWIFGLPFFTVAMVGSTLMRAVGDAVTPGYLMTIGSVLQVLIAPIFIFGLLGVNEMGLHGAAIAFILARSVSFMMYSYVIIVRDKLINPDMSGFVDSVKEIMHVGLPAIASNLITPISMGVITRLLAGHGAAVVAGFGVASRIESMIAMVLFAQAMSIAPFIGQNWGAALFDRVKQALGYANIFSMAWGAIAYVFLFFSAAFLVALMNDDPEVIEAATTYLLISPLVLGFMGVVSNSTSVFNALGKPMPSLVISVLQSIALNIPLAILGDYLFGYKGIFIAWAFTMVLMATLSWFWINRTIEDGIKLRLPV